MTRASRLRPGLVTTSDRIVSLRAAGVSLVVDLRPTVPVVLHWGVDLGPLSDAAIQTLSATSSTSLLANAPDEPREFSLLPTGFEGWSGVPANRRPPRRCRDHPTPAHRIGGAQGLVEIRTTTTAEEAPEGGAPTTSPVEALGDDGGRIDVRLVDEVSGLKIQLAVRLTGLRLPLLDHLSLVDHHSIDFLKWDHNRDLHEAVHRGPYGDRPGVRDQTLAPYALLDELRRRHPGLEIESFAYGGCRVDPGVLERTYRIWTSDSNDPIERQSIQRWTEALVPPEYIGTHIGASRAHTTNRVSDVSFRLVTTLFGSAGIEWDVTRCSQSEIDQLARWAVLYKEFRGLVNCGRRVQADLADEETLLHGSVAADASAALFSWVRLASSAPGQPGRVPFPGLDPTRA